MKRAGLALAASVTLAAGVISGCGGSSDPPTPEPAVVVEYVDDVAGWDKNVGEWNSLTQAERDATTWEAWAAAKGYPLTFEEYSAKNGARP